LAAIPLKADMILAKQLAAMKLLALEKLGDKNLILNYGTWALGKYQK